MNMSLSRRQKNESSPTTGEPSFNFDVESPTRDLSCLNISPMPPPPFRPSFRTLQPKPEQRERRPASYLWHMWEQYRSQGSESLGGDTALAAASATAEATQCANLGHSHNRHAPSSADGVHTLQDRQQQQRRRRRRRPQAHKKLSPYSGDSGRGRGHWVRLKNIGCRISLVFVVGALAFDLYFACGGRREGESSARKGGLFSATTAAFFTSSHRANEDSRDGLFPDFPDPPSSSDRAVPRSQKAEHVDDGHTGYSRRPTWDHGAKTGNGPLLNGNGSPQTGLKRASPLIGSGVVIKPRVGQEALAEGEFVAAAATDVGVRLDEPVPGEAAWGSQKAPQSLQHDPFDGQRVAVVVPYIGRELPVWWDAFAEQARLNDGLIDWIIFCDQARNTLPLMSYNCNLRSI